MNSAAKAVAVILTLFMVAYVGYQSYQFFYNPYETEIVLKEQYLEDLELDGFFVRDEFVLPEQKQGVIGYNYNNAEKVSNGSVVASRYSRQEDLYALREAAELEAVRAVLTDAQQSASMQGMKLDLLVKQVSDSRLSVLQSVDSGDLSGLTEKSHTLMSRIDILNAFVDADEDYTQSISELDSRINALRSSVTEPGDTIVSTESGYFSAMVDGQEETLTPDLLENLTISQAKQILANKTIDENSTSVGKIVRDAAWSYVAVITAEQAALFTEGQTVTLNFTAPSVQDAVVIVSRLITDKESGEAVIVLAGTNMDEATVTMRFEKVKAVVKNYTGIIIPKSAIRVRQEESDTGEVVNSRGVYTMVGTMVRFKKIESLYEDEYVVVSKIVNDSSYVSIYDEVIIKGKDLNVAAE